MPRRLTFLPVVLALLASAPGAAAWATPAGCARGSAVEAGHALVHPAAELSDFEEVAGLRTALLLEPLVYPGVRHRLIQAEDFWCDASGFNAAWRLAGGSKDAVRIASAYSSLAAAPYFDGVTVRGAREIAPGLVSLQTHALTNGITARWLIHVDAEGVRRATWTATDLAVPPFVAEIEGVTASPGVERSYVRAADGTVRALEAILPEPGAPELVTEGKTVDDFTIRLLYGETQYSPNLGQDTSVDLIDRPRIVLKMLLDNYKEFYDWGFRKNWETDLGQVWIDSNTAMTCWACVYIREDFNIHLSSAVTQILAALGFQYPDDKQALATVLGHEMTHDWQNAYYKPEQNDAFASVAFVEGMARMQESLHSYSGVSHQPNSLIYSVGHSAAGQEPLAANSCNGWDGTNIETAFANGVFTNKTYNACYFWLSWFPRHGTSGFVDMFSAVYDHAKKAGHAEVMDSLVQAVGFETYTDDLAAWAQAAITGKGYSWISPGSTGPERDWGIHLDRWSPEELTGTQWNRAIGNGGITAREIKTGGYVSKTSLTTSFLYVIRDDGTTATRTLVNTDDGVADFVPAPAAGERVWLIAVKPGLGTTNVVVRLTPQP